MASSTGSWRLLYRLPLLLLHVSIGLPLTLLFFSAPGRAMHISERRLNDVMQAWWSGSLCRIFGVRRQVEGAFPPGPCLIAANHISWLDIQVLHSISPMGFVAKAEIARWPLAGWVAGFGDTVYHRRGSHDSSSSVMEAMKERLAEHKKVAIFAEGGILAGDGVKRFHARLFGAAIESAVPVQPVMLRYQRNGYAYPEITFLRGEHFMANFFRLLRQAPCTAEVAILPTVAPEGKQRRELASEAQFAVETAFTRGVTA